MTHGRWRSRATSSHQPARHQLRPHGQPAPPPRQQATQPPAISVAGRFCTRSISTSIATCASRSRPRSRQPVVAHRSVRAYINGSRPRRDHMGAPGTPKSAHSRDKIAALGRHTIDHHHRLTDATSGSRRRSLESCPHARLPARLTFTDVRQSTSQPSAAPLQVQALARYAVENARPSSRASITDPLGSAPNPACSQGYTSRSIALRAEATQAARRMTGCHSSPREAQPSHRQNPPPRSRTELLPASVGLDTPSPNKTNMQSCSQHPPLSRGCRTPAQARRDAALQPPNQQPAASTRTLMPAAPSNRKRSVAPVLRRQKATREIVVALRKAAATTPGNAPLPRDCSAKKASANATLPSLRRISPPIRAPLRGKQSPPHDPSAGIIITI